jgi:hypothetical protein
MRSRFAFIWVLLTAAIAGVSAWFAYGAGVTTKIATTAATGTDGVPPAYYYGYYGHPGFGFFPFGFFWLFFVIFILFLVFRARRGWGHGNGPKGMHGVPPGIEDRLESWHKRAHDEDKTTQ